MAQRNSFTTPPFFFASLSSYDQEQATITTGCPYRLFKLSLDSMIGSIQQVLSFPNKKLLVITDIGLLYAVEGNIMNTDRLDSKPFAGEFKLVWPFDGSQPDLKAVQMAAQTKAALIVAKTKTQSLIYGIGNNSHFRMSRFKTQTFSCDKPEIMFDPLNDLAVKPYRGEDCEITHVGCCYSFSVCVLNGYHVHFTGQNWFFSRNNLVEGYHCWKHRSQTMKTRVVKLECGDFHVVLLHEDGSVSVAGSNNFSQLTPKAKFSGDNVFCTLDLNYLSVQDIFSGSNSMIYVKDVYNTSKIIYYAGAAMPSEFVPSQNEPMEISEIRHEKENEISLISGSNRELFDVQYTRDFCLLRYWDRPHLLFLYGCRYYPYKKIEQTMVDLSKLFPYNRFTTSTNFYRDILQVRVQCLGFAIYCDFQKHSKSRMFQQLFKTLDSETPNHHLLYDISII